MEQIFLLADDMTGALDTAVHFAMRDLSTVVVTEQRASDIASIAKGQSVVVVCLATRHLPSEKAYEMVCQATKQAVDAGFRYFFKKTDSVLRGNIGAELTAMQDAAGVNRLDFFPAFPAMKRTTRQGVQWVNGTPIHQSVFSRDPFDPIMLSYIPDIIAQQSNRRCDVVPVGESAPESGEKRICIYDAQSTEQLRSAVAKVHAESGLKVFAGCGGLADALQDVLSLKTGTPSALHFDGKLLVVCGSLNDISKNQLEYAQRNGFARFTLTAEQCLSRQPWDDDLVEEIRQLYDQSPALILETGQPSGKASQPIECTTAWAEIAQNIGLLVRCLLERGIGATYMIIGGDTLQAVLESLACATITPVREICPGVVASRCSFQGREMVLLSKSGGFGEESLLVQLSQCIREEAYHNE